MKLYDAGKAPNPRRVRIFLAEKGLPCPELVPVDLNAGEHRSAAFTALNPWQRTPVLVLDDGTAIAETVAICRYFDAIRPDPPLFGTGAVGAANVEMWNRRAELGLLMTVAFAFRHLHPGMTGLEVPQVPAWGEVNKERAADEMVRLDARLATAPFLAGESFTIADITAGLAMDMLKVARIDVPSQALHLKAWHEGLRSRPGWSA